MQNIIVEKEITNLQPSLRLLEYYRKKVAQSENDRIETRQLLDAYKTLTANTEFYAEREQMVNDLEELRTALSDINVFIHAERQQVTKLHLENEILKTEQQLAEKKIEILLQLSGLTSNQLQLYLRRSKKTLNVSSAAAVKFKKDSDIEIPNDDVKSCVEETLESKLKILQDHFNLSKEAWEEERNSLLEDRAIKKAEAKAQREQYEAHVNLITAKIAESQKLSHEATKTAVETKHDMQKAQLRWLAEKDKLLMDLERLKTSLPNKDSVQGIWRSESLRNLHQTPRDSCDVRHLRREINSLKKELRDAEELKVLYENQYRKLEREFCHFREQKEAELSIFKEKLHKANEVKELYKKQRDKLDDRRRTQAEGFENELKLVKTDLHRVIQQFFKLTNFYSQSDDLPDLATVNDIKLATTLARSVHNSIVKAKRKVFSVE